MSRSSKRRDGPHRSGSSAISVAGRRLVGPVGGGAPGGLGGVGPGERDDVGQRVLADLGDRCPRRPADERRERAADLADAAREQPGDLVRPDERLPLAERLGTQERAAGEVVAEGRELRLERGLGAPAKGIGLDRLVLQRRRPRAGAAARAPRGCRRAPGRRGPAGHPGPRPRASIRARSGATASAASPSIRSSSAPSGMASTARVAASASGAEPSRPRASTPNSASRRSTSSSTATRSASAAGMRLTTTTSGRPRSRARSEDVPRHAVGVAGRGRHEDPEVRGLGEAVGQLAVRVLDGVDVRGIDERDPAWLALVRRRPAAARRRGSTSGRAVAHQRIAVLGMDDGDELAGRRPQDAGS